MSERVEGSSVVIMAFCRGSYLRWLNHAGSKGAILLLWKGWMVLRLSILSKAPVLFIYFLLDAVW